MKVSIVFFAASITVALAGCPTKKIYNQPNCLPKSEYDPYWQRTLTFTSANGPCFKGSKEPMCFVNKGWLEIPCECSDSACGCSASFAPQCSGTQPTNVGAQCGKHVCAQGVDQKGAKIILDEHNRLRRLVASGGGSGTAKPGCNLPAGEIPDLEWDENLAKGAQDWINHCIWEHDNDADRAKRCGLSPNVWVGQNLASASWSGYNSKREYVKLVDEWYGEIKYMLPKNIDPWSTAGNTGETGHLTQLLWSGSKKVGCGFIEFVTKDSWYTQWLACNYLPGGNMGGGMVYKAKPLPANCK